MSYNTTIAGLKERLGTVPGLASLNNEPAIIEGIPVNGVPVTPLIFLLYGGGGVGPSGNVAGGPRARLVGSQFDLVSATLLIGVGTRNDHEERLRPFVDGLTQVFAANERDANHHPYPTLGGRVEMTVIERIRSGELDGHLMIKDTRYRAITLDLKITRR